MTQANDHATAETNVYVGVCDLESIEDRIPVWPGMTIKERLRYIREVLEPIDESWSSNTTRVGLDEARALQLDQSRTVDDNPLELAIGDGNTTPEYSNRSLNNELGRVDIAASDVSGTSIILNAFLPRERLNDDGSGENPELVELGVVTEDGRLFNHSLFSRITKNAQRGVQFEVHILVVD